MFKNKILQSVLIKPAGPDCNMGCTYCFYMEKSALFSETGPHRMSPDILDTLVRQVMTQGGDAISFGWQGGEPTLMGVPFYEKAVEFQQRYGRPGQTCGNGLQTNGILIDRTWARFLSDARFLVGLSLDGPEHVHDRYRCLKNGQSSWKKVTAARERLLEADAEVNALVVVNDYSVRFPEEIYRYHQQAGLTFMQFIPCIEPDPEVPGKPVSFSVPPEDYGHFLIRLFDLWRQDFNNGQPTTYIRWFESLFFTYVNMLPPECTLLPECGIYTVVEHNGDIFSCDFFVEPQWRLGNIMQDNLIDCLNSEQQQRFGNAKSRLPDVCRNCRWLIHCRGGCPKERGFQPAHPALSYLCPGYQLFFEHADPVFRKMAETWKMQQKKQRIREQIRLSGTKVRRNDPCPCGSGKKYKLCCGRD